MKAKNYNDDIWRGISQILAIGLIVSLTIFWTVFQLGIVWSLVLGYGTWGITLCLFPSIFDQMIFTVNKNYGIVVGDNAENNAPLPTGIPNDEAPKESVAMRECGPGPHGKWIWESTVTCFDTRKRLLLGGELHVPDKNNKYWHVKWQGFGTPLAGSLVNLARISEKSAQMFFQGYFDAALTREITNGDGDEIQKNQGHLSEWFQNLLDGPKKTHELEIKNGMFTHTPQILSMIPDEAVQASSQEIIEARNDLAAAQIYADGFKIGMLDAAKLVFARAGKIKMFDGVKTVLAEDK